MARRNKGHMYATTTDWDKDIKMGVPGSEYKSSKPNRKRVTMKIPGQAIESLEKSMKVSIAKMDQVKEATDWKKVSKTRKTRGYDFEDKIRTHINKIDSEDLWHCRRLGGSSTGLPDLVITYNKIPLEVIVAMECKSGKDVYVLEIPHDQIYRIVDTLKAFQAYHYMGIGFGFKFARSEKCKRKKSLERYWILPYNDSYIDGERDNLMSVTYDIRKDSLTFWYADGGHRVLAGTIQNNWYPDIYRLVEGITGLD